MKKYAITSKRKNEVKRFFYLISKVNQYVDDNPSKFRINYQQAPSYEKANLISIHLEGWTFMDEVIYRGKTYFDVWAKDIDLDDSPKNLAIASTICHKNHPINQINNSNYQWDLVKRLDNNGWSSKIIGSNKDGKYFCLFSKGDLLAAGTGKDLAQAIIQAAFVAKQGGVPISYVKRKIVRLVFPSKRVLVA